MSQVDDSVTQTFLVNFDGKDYKITRKSLWKKETLTENSFKTSRNSIITYKSPTTGNIMEILKADYSNLFQIDGNLQSIDTEFNVDVNVPLIKLDGKISGK